MMRIGVLTFHRVANAGSILQAIATCRALAVVFPEARIEVIDYSPLTGLLYESRMNLVSKNPLKTLKGLKSILQLKAFINKNVPLSAKRLITDSFYKSVNFINGNKYDVILVGSDTVFEFRDKGKRYAPPLPNAYWLPPEINAHKIAFAVSADRSNLDLWTPEIQRIAKRSIESFSLIGYRDSFTGKILESLNVSEKIMIRIPDPTFTFEIRETSVKEKLQSAGVDLGGKVLVLNLNTEPLSKEVCAHFKNKGYQIVALNNNKYADIILHGLLTPFEWAEMPRYVNLVITNRFHGTIFAMKNKVPFLSIDDTPQYSKSDFSKKKDLLMNCNFPRHYVSYEECRQNTSCIFERAKEIENSYDREAMEIILRRQSSDVFNFLHKVKDFI